jgi:hypothetical protein
MIKHQCINDEATLFETISPDVWQRRVLAADGSELGVAVAEVIEPRQCAVRYLILLDVRNHRRLLLPATYVVDAEDGSIISSIEPAIAAHLPACPIVLTRADEVVLHQQLGCRPYWTYGQYSPDSDLLEDD